MYVTARHTTNEYSQRREGTRLRVVANTFSIGFALAMLSKHLRAESAYAIYPWLALLPPLLLSLAFPAYRNRLWLTLRKLWNDSEAFSRGGKTIPWMSALVLVLIPSWLIYLSNQKTKGAIDTRPVVPTALSILNQGDTELGEYFTPRSKPCLRDRNGEIGLCFRAEKSGIYSGYPAGMVPFALVTASMAKILDADLDQAQVLLRLEKMTAAAVAASAVAFFYLTALCLAPARASWVASAVLALNSGMFSTVGMALWQHGGIILWTAVAVFIEFLGMGKPTRKGTVMQGVCCGMLVSCRLTSATVLIPFGLWVLLRNPKRTILLGVVAVLTFFPWAWFYQSTYGSPFGPSMSFLSQKLWSNDMQGPLLGVLFSPARGLLVYQPWIVLVPLLLVFGTRSIPSVRRVPPGWKMFCSSAILIHILLIAAWGCWWGGWCWGSRLVVDVVPLFALLCVVPIDGLLNTRYGWVVLLSLSLTSLAIHLPGVYGDPSIWNRKACFPGDLWSWRHAPFLW